MKTEAKRIWRLLQGQRLLYGSAMVALVLAAATMYLVPLVPQAILDGVLSEDVSTASPSARLLVRWMGGQEILAQNLWIPCLAIVFLTGLAGVLTYFRGRWSALASEAIARTLRDRLYNHLQHLPCAYFDKAATGDLVQRCTSDVETLRQFLATQLVEIGRASFMFLVPIPLMLSMDPWMTLAAVILVPPIVIFSAIFFRRVQSAFKQVDEAEGHLTSRLQENLTGIRVVRAFARQEHEAALFDERNRLHRDLDCRMYKIMGWYWSISDVLVMSQKALVIGLGGWWLATGKMQVGTFYFFLAAVNLFIWPIRMMGRLLTELGKALVAIRRIDEVLRVPRESEPVQPKTFVGSGGEIQFKNVSFAYPESPRVLDDVTFTAEPGQTVALLGPSGSGKSTIVSVLLRLYDPQIGEVLLDGNRISSIPRKEIRSRIAVVMQDPFLYSKTVMENIRLGRSSAEEGEIQQAAGTAHVHQAIQEFEGGYETLVGERGVTLSGGQRQRVALARALLDQPDVLVLDDALSAVDTRTEKLILRALKKRRGNHTTLVIAHRLSTLMHADKILVIEQGRIVQQGTHEQLTESAGLYQRLWKLESTLAQEMSDSRIEGSVT